MPITDPAKTFPDIVGHPDQAAIEALAQRSIINGKDGGVFDPGGSMTRCEFAAIVTRALGLEPAECLVLEDSCNGVRAGAAGGFVTVLVPDMVPADEEMRSLCTLECESLNQVLEKLQAGEL